ncbi:MAG: ASKHA domain-containing protein, partial [Chloroflexota bacterium]
VGLTGAGLIQLVSVLREQDVIDVSGRMATNHSRYGNSITQDSRGARRFNLLTVNDSDNIFLTQMDVRELQKAKGAMAAATLTLMKRLDLEPSDLDRMILTGSFGSQLDVNAILNLGMIPAVDPSIVETPANGAGLGAALMLQADEFARAESIAQRAIQVDLDVEAGFNQRYLDSLALQPIG